ncbi:MAG: hypothetical protein K8U03_23220 [Planctomycetia bacterium]|nr:hypothetical protein [Planctomycetia bacterium]
METIPYSSSFLRALITGSTDPCVSIYLSTKRDDGGLRRAPIHLKNYVTAIESRWEERGVRTSVVRELVAPLRKLIDDEKFWQSQHRHGLAVFLRSTTLRCFGLRNSPRPGLWIGSRAYILPLLAREENSDPYRLLAVSANAAAVYDANRDDLHPLSIDSLPIDLADALRLDQPTALVQVMNSPVGATFHGQGGEIDRRKSELHDYFRMIDRALHSYLAKIHLPLVFAGVDYLFPIYREVNTYPMLVPDSVSGNPEHMGLVELHRRAEAVLEGWRRSILERDLADFEKSVGGPRTADLLTDVLAASHEGAVECLFVAAGRSVWGRYEPEIDRLALTYPDDPASDDLLNLVAVQTLKHRGRVYLMAGTEVPHGVVAAALLRYARSTTS